MVWDEVVWCREGGWCGMSWYGAGRVDAVGRMDGVVWVGGVEERATCAEVLLCGLGLVGEACGVVGCDRLRQAGRQAG